MMQTLTLACGLARLEVLPERGGAVTRLELPWRGASFSVLAGYPTLKGWNSDPQYRGTFLLPWPNRIRGGRYTFAGVSQQLPVNEPNLGHALHGFIGRCPFTQTATDMPHRLRLTHDTQGDYPGYPFRIWAALTFDLSEDGFACAVEVVSTDALPLPLGFGWHPYFSLGVPVDDLRLRIPAAWQAITDQNMIPTGARTQALDWCQGRSLLGLELDTLFLLDPGTKPAVTRLEDPARGLALELWQDRNDGALDYLCAYTPPDRQSIALEPMSCASDAFNNGLGLRILAPGESITFRFGVRLEDCS